MSTTQKVIVVTGANKGIGRAIVEGLLDKTTDTVIYLTARDVSRGTATLKELAPKVKSTSNTVKYAQLDVTDEKSIENFANVVKAAEGKIDVLVNNAGVAFGLLDDASSLENAKTTLDVNYYGVKRVVEGLLTLLRPGSRIINVASEVGIMPGVYPEFRIKQLSSATTVREVDNFVEEYLKELKAGNSVVAGFPPNSYRVSKSAVLAYSDILSKMLAPENIVVYSMCPGFTDTDLTHHNGHRTVEQGADTAVYLATTPKLPFNGGFIKERKLTAWYDCNPFLPPLTPTRS